MRLLHPGKSHRQKYISLGNYKIVVGHREIQSDHILPMLICELESFHNFIQISNRQTTQMFLVQKHHLVLMVSFFINFSYKYYGFKAQKIILWFKVWWRLWKIIKNQLPVLVIHGDKVVKCVRMSLHQDYCHLHHRLYRQAQARTHLLETNSGLFCSNPSKGVALRQTTALSNK